MKNKEQPVTVKQTYPGVAFTYWYLNNTWHYYQ